MDILQKKGLEIAERTNLNIINSEIEDWETGIKDLNKQIKKLEIQRALDSKRLHLWKLAKYYKEKYSKSKSRPTGADN